MSEKQEPKYCEQCGSPLEHKVPEDELRERLVCPSCGYIRYINPHNIVGTVPTYQGKVLLCRRAMEPQVGFWNLPAGHQELKESTMEGALRETFEESGAILKDVKPLMLFDVPFYSGTHVYFTGEVTNPDCQPGPETQEQRFFSEEEIPWDQIAFNSVKRALRVYFSRRKGSFDGLQYEVKETLEDE